MRHSQHRKTPPNLLLPSLLLLHTLVPILATLSCQTPLNFDDTRLPAVLEVENNCATNPIAVCFEYDKVIYLIQNMNPTSLRTFSTMYDDCWVFRAHNCDGPTLLEHKVAGTRKLTVGCTKEETDANALLLSQSTTVDCSLTTTPQITDVFNASLHLIPDSLKQDLSDDLFNHRNTPMQFLKKHDLLRGVYEMCYDLARHGADVNSTYSMFRHIRAVIRHTESCHPELVGTDIGIANAYLALYGFVSAHLHASLQQAGSWIATPPELTTSQQTAYENMVQVAMSLDLAMDLPSFVLPGIAEGIGAGEPLAGVRIIRNETWNSRPRRAEWNRTALRMGSAMTGEEICSAEPGGWKFKKLTGATVANGTVDCCSPVCFLLEKVVGGLMDGQSFLDNCCLNCNLQWCTAEIPVQTVAVLHAAEVQLQKIGVQELERPFKVILL